MRAITTLPGKADSAELEDLPEPETGRDRLLVQALAVGVCGTDVEILRGDFGTAAPGKQRLVIGHESLGRVLKAPAGSGFAEGELIAGVVRRPDPAPCASCAAQEWDMCRNGQYTERGIKGLDGYAAERYALEPGFTVKLPPSLAESHLGVLVEPASIIAKGWEHIDHIAARSRWEPRRALITGAGPIGLLAALMAKQRGLDVHIFDHNKTGPKPAIAAALGATYHAGPVKDGGVAADVVMECTGVPELVIDVMHAAGPNGIVCLTGISAGARPIPVDVAALNKELVLENNVVFGTVNANLRHYQVAITALERADRGWLKSLITRRVPLDRWQEALEKRPGDVKTIIEL